MKVQDKSVGGGDALNSQPTLQQRAPATQSGSARVVCNKTHIMVMQVG
jgi:hypothetical protein